MGDAEAGAAPSAPSTPEIQPYGGFKLNAFVKRGTTTYAHDMRVAALEEDANRRRAQADYDRAVANTPIEDGGGKMYTHRLASRKAEELNAQQAYLRLRYITNRGERITYKGEEFVGLCELMMLEGRELAVMIVCPRCVNNKVPMGQAQMRIRQANKKFDFDPTPSTQLGDGKAGDFFMFEGVMYRSAGVIRESEKFRCDNCDWAARIVNNEIRSEGESA